MRIYLLRSYSSAGFSILITNEHLESLWQRDFDTLDEACACAVARSQDCDACEIFVDI